MSRIAFLFPGQGAQHVGMGKTIAENYPAARELYHRASEILEYDLAKLCFEGPSAELDSTVISQPALFVTSLAALEMLRADSPDKVLACEMAAGLSLGEYTALVFAGAMSFEDGLRVVQRRGEAMQAAADANPSGMVSILLLDREKVAEICQSASSAGKIWIANYVWGKQCLRTGSGAGRAGGGPGDSFGGGRGIPYGNHEAGGQSPVRSVGRSRSEETGNSRDFQRRRRNSRRTR